MLPHRYLGNSGLQVSILSFGNWLTADNEEDEKNCIDCIKAAHKGGVTFFDTAEVYGFGRAETVMGRAIKELEADRRDLVISTKLFRCPADGVNNFMMSRKHIVEGMKSSLERLDLDYVDVVFSHRPDIHTPLLETCRAYDHIIEEGQAFYWATSEWSNERIAQAIELCERYDLHKPIADQCQYNMLWRDNGEKDLRPLYEDYSYGTTIWSPLAGGLLTGKHNDLKPKEGRYTDENSRAKHVWGMYMAHFDEDQLKTKLTALGELAKEVGCTQAQLSLAWCLVNKDITTSIFGASKVEQVESNLQALEVAKKWTPELEEKVATILENEPSPAMDFNEFKPKKGRRGLRVDYDLQ